MKKNKKIGIMTSGGDCPGLNAVIRAIVKSAINNYDYQVVGFKDGYKGLVENNFTKLGVSDVSGILDKGGTILGTTNRYNPFCTEINIDGEKLNKDMTDRIKFSLDMHEIDCLVVIGGEDTLKKAAKLSEKGINIVAVPKTIDNDIFGTDLTFGFMTAVDTATEAIDKLHSTAESHHRVMITEVMGRATGWIALEAGMAGGADIILIPEIPYDINKIAKRVLMRKNAGKGFSIIVAAEGAFPKGGRPIYEEDSLCYLNDGGIGNVLATELTKIVDIETRVTVLGYLQRGGSPSPFDRILSTRLGAYAIEMINDNKYGKMACIKNNSLTSINLNEIADKLKMVEPQGELVSIARKTGVSMGD